MRILLFSIVSCICHFVDATIDFDAYCALKCDTPSLKHTVCEYKCQLGPDCKDFANHPFSDEEREHMRDMHNYYRNRLASGNDTRGENGAAKNMLIINYHKTTEVSTLCWGRRCLSEHDVCRQTLGLGDHAGQNIYVLAEFQPIDTKGREYINDSVWMWYEEIKYTTREIIESFPRGITRRIGHFTQLVWADTKYVGCSRISFTTSFERKYILQIICNYSPAGNFIGAPVYEYGRGCTGYDDTNSKYTALCGVIDETIIGESVDYDKVTKRKAINVMTVYFVSVVYLVVLWN